MEGARGTHEMSVAANHRRKSVDNAALSQEDLAALTLSPSHVMEHLDSFEALPQVARWKPDHLVKLHVRIEKLHNQHA